MIGIAVGFIFRVPELLAGSGLEYRIMAYINVAGVLQKQSEKYCHWSRINYWS